MTLTRSGSFRASDTSVIRAISGVQPRMSAACRSRPASPMTTGTHVERTWSDSTALTVTSGPTPAPSPMVTAMMGSPS